MKFVIVFAVLAVVAVASEQFVASPRRGSARKTQSKAAPKVSHFRGRGGVMYAHSNAQAKATPGKTLRGSVFRGRHSETSVGNLLDKLDALIEETVADAQPLVLAGANRLGLGLRTEQFVASPRRGSARKKQSNAAPKISHFRGRGGVMYAHSNAPAKANSGKTLRGSVFRERHSEQFVASPRRGSARKKQSKAAPKISHFRGRGGVMYAHSNAPVKATPGKTLRGSVFRGRHSEVSVGNLLDKLDALIEETVADAPPLSVEDLNRRYVR